MTCGPLRNVLALVVRSPVSVSGGSAVARDSWFYTVRLLPEAGGPTIAFQWAPEQLLGTRSFYFPVAINMREKEGLQAGGLYGGSNLFTLTQWHRLRP